MMSAMRTSSLRALKGFSLIELLAAITIFGLGSLALLSLFVVNVESTELSSGLTEATNLAQERIEEISTGSFEDAVAQNYPDEAAGSIYGYPEFSRTVQIQDDVPSAGFKTVTVSTSWVEDGGHTHAVTLRTIISEDVSM